MSAVKCLPLVNVHDVIGMSCMLIHAEEIKSYSSLSARRGHSGILIQENSIELNMSLMAVELKSAKEIYY